MSSATRIFLVALTCGLFVSIQHRAARAQEIQENVVAEEPAVIEADPAALKAFEEVVKTYRAFPSLTVKSVVKIELSQDGAAATGSEVKGEFIFGPQRAAVLKLRGFTCYLNNGTINAIHDKTEGSYYSVADDGSPYYTLLTSFVDMPFPEFALMIGEETTEDVLMQFHPRAPYVQPVAVSVEETDGKKLQHIKLASEHEQIDMRVDPETKLIQSIELRISGGDMVQPGAVMVYKHSYEYQVHDVPLDASVFTFDPGTREQVDMMASLRPAPTPQEGGAEHGALVGKPAPPMVLATADGKAIDLEELRGRVVVLDFWATWCGPCMQALPMLHEVAKWAAEEQLPVTVLTVNVWEVRNPEENTPDARLASAKQTWDKRGFTLPIVMDYSDESAAAYGVRSIPTTIIIRSDGIVHAQHVGASGDYVEAMKADIEAAIEAVEVQPAHSH